MKKIIAIGIVGASLVALGVACGSAQSPETTDPARADSSGGASAHGPGTSLAGTPSMSTSPSAGTGTPSTGVLSNTSVGPSSGAGITTSSGGIH